MTGNTAAAGHREDLDALAERVCSDVLSPLPRRDQRRRGLDFVRGLLATPGRKSIRNIAVAGRGPADDQRLHHLVSASTWGWGPVRGALRDHVVTSTPVHAWVPRPMTMPRTGRHGVGVRHGAGGPGAASAQHAVALWAVSVDVTTPVEWRLRLDAEWLDDPERCRSASVPERVREESDTDAVAAVCAAAGPGDAPVVVDATGIDPPALLRALRRHRRPVMAMVAADTPVVAADRRSAAGACELAAGRLLAATATRRRPTGSVDATGDWTAAVPVWPRSPVRAVGSGRRPRPLLLVGSGPVGAREPERLWLTDMVDEPPEALVALGGALDAVAGRERAGSASAAGVGHYGGRSYETWHRHTTLASVAHAVRELAGTVPPVPPAHCRPTAG